MYEPVVPAQAHLDALRRILKENTFSCLKLFDVRKERVATGNVAGEHELLHAQRIGRCIAHLFLDPESVIAHIQLLIASAIKKRDTTHPIHGGTEQPVRLQNEGKVAVQLA